MKPLLRGRNCLPATARIIRKRLHRLKRAGTKRRHYGKSASVIPGGWRVFSGDSGVKGLEASSDVKFEQLLKPLTHFPIALSINARYRRWEFWVDGRYIEVITSATLPGLLFTDAKAVVIADMLPPTVIHYLERLIGFSRQAAASLPVMRRCSLRLCGRISGRKRSFCYC